ncbi:MAG TPA: hypothetical protein VNO18_06840, partial [Xanthobacteraceae bacterium]|nr:hypothetical protein [Xanthobacteraceae bacterium]
AVSRYRNGDQKFNAVSDAVNQRPRRRIAVYGGKAVPKCHASAASVKFVKKTVKIYDLLRFFIHYRICPFCGHRVAPVHSV